MTTLPRSLAIPTRYHRLWRQLRWHRRKLAALCAAVAVFATLHALRPPAPATVAVVAASHDLAAGATLQAGDLITTRLPEGAIPDQTLPAADLIGRSLAAAVARGTPLTRPSLAGDEWQHLSPGRAAVAVRLQDAALAGLLSPGQHVGLIAVDPRSPSEATQLVDDAVVLAVPAIPSGSATGTPGRLVVFDVPTNAAEVVTSSAVSRYLTVIWGH